MANANSEDQGKREVTISACISFTLAILCLYRLGELGSTDLSKMSFEVALARFEAAQTMCVGGAIASGFFGFVLMSLRGAVKKLEPLPVLLMVAITFVGVVIVVVGCANYIGSFFPA